MSDSRHESRPGSGDPQKSPENADIAPGDADNARLKRLSEKARGLPESPGVYLMKDAQGRVLYVGKALRLPNRVGGYFQPSADEGPRKQAMLGLIEDVEVIECDGEWEALLLEARLIKDIRPRFNSRMTDGKSFPYLAITMREEFPAVHVTRTPSDPRFKGAKLFGPFTSAGDLRRAVQLLQRIISDEPTPVT